MMFDDDTGTVPPQELLAYDSWAMNVALLSGGGLALKNAILSAILVAKKAGADVNDPQVRRGVVARAGREVEMHETEPEDLRPASIH